MTSVGRPAFRATPALRRKVEELVMAGMSRDDIGRAIGCTRPTLDKHFPEELACGLAKKRAEVVGMLFQSAKKGNVSAQKKLEEMSRLAGGDSASKGQPVAGRGKKEQAAADAKTAGQGTEWGEDLSPPPSALN